MVTMAAATLAIVFIPTYAQIGVWSSVLLVVVRLAPVVAHRALAERVVHFTASEKAERDPYQ